MFFGPVQACNPVQVCGQCVGSGMFSSDLRGGDHIEDGKLKLSPTSVTFRLQT